jgi:hypothetical protein
MPWRGQLWLDDTRCQQCGPDPGYGTPTVDYGTDRQVTLGQVEADIATSGAPAPADQPTPVGVLTRTRRAFARRRRAQPVICRHCGNPTIRWVYTHPQRGEVPDVALCTACGPASDPPTVDYGEDTAVTVGQLDADTARALARSRAGWPCPRPGCRSNTPMHIHEE